MIQRHQPPPQALRFSHGRGERETRVTGDEPQGTMGRVQKAGEATSRPLSPSRLPLRAHFHQKRDVWVRGSNVTTTATGTPTRTAITQKVKIRQTTTLHVHHAFLYTSLPSLHDYNVKVPNFNNNNNNFPFLFLNFDTVL